MNALEKYVAKVKLASALMEKLSAESRAGAPDPWAQSKFRLPNKSNALSKRNLGFKPPKDFVSPNRIKAPLSNADKNDVRVGARPADYGKRAQPLQRMPVVGVTGKKFAPTSSAMKKAYGWQQ